jgi:hypothetical protein
MDYRVPPSLVVLENPRSRPIFAVVAAVNRETAEELACTVAGSWTSTLGNDAIIAIMGHEAFAQGMVYTAAARSPTSPDDQAMIIHAAGFAAPIATTMRPRSSWPSQPRVR